MGLQISVTIDVTSNIFKALTIFTSHTHVSCAHELKANGHASIIDARWALSIGVATVANTKALLFSMLMDQFDAH